MNKAFCCSTIRLLFNIGKACLLMYIISISAISCTIGNHSAKDNTSKCHYYVLRHYLGRAPQKSDTVYVCNIDPSEYCIIWNNDTILSDINYSGSANHLVSYLGAVGINNTFIINKFGGDGCPEGAYQILHFNGDDDITNFHLSEDMGNCSSNYSILLKTDAIVLSFNSGFGAHGAPIKYTYYIKSNKVEVQTK